MYSYYVRERNQIDFDNCKQKGREREWELNKLLVVELYFSFW